MFRKFSGRLFVFLFWTAVWFFLAAAVDNPFLIASPGAVLAVFPELIVTTAFWETVAGSLLRIGAGFLAGLSGAVLLAWVSFRFRVVRELLKPMIGLMKTVPVASFAVLLLIWWGSSLLAVAVSFVVVLPNLYINLLEGLENADRKLLEMGAVFQLSGWKRFFYLYRPSLRPFLESGLKLSLGMSWKSGVAAEVIGTPAHSIGGQMYLAKIYLDVPELLAWTAVTIVLSLCMEKLVLHLSSRFFAWKPSCKRADGSRKRTKDTAAAHDAEGIILQNIGKAYGDKVVLDKVSAVYERGQTYYLTGPSGSGKTTLLRILGGLEQPDRGSVRRTGACSMVFQEDRLCEDCSALLNVALVIGDLKRARAALEEVLEADALEKPCSQLSGGMRRRVAVVRAMETESEAVLLDEPFTGMDDAARERTERYIRKRQQGRTLVIAAHGQEEKACGLDEGWQS